MADVTDRGGSYCAVVGVVFHQPQPDVRSAAGGNADKIINGHRLRRDDYHSPQMLFWTCLIEQKVCPTNSVSPGRELQPMLDA